MTKGLVETLKVKKISILTIETKETHTVFCSLLDHFHQYTNMLSFLPP